jgi:hypothetical protein
MTKNPQLHSRCPPSCIISSTTRCLDAFHPRCGHFLPCLSRAAALRACFLHSRWGGGWFAIILLLRMPPPNAAGSSPFLPPIHIGYIEPKSVGGVSIVFVLLAITPETHLEILEGDGASVPRRSLLLELRGSLQCSPPWSISIKTSCSEEGKVSFWFPLHRWDWILTCWCFRWGGCNSLSWIPSPTAASISPLFPAIDFAGSSPAARGRWALYLLWSASVV